ncbi:MAG TPA: hypothetical protein VNB89_05490, partial [Gemmatimonadaceae bacterium]|nr:hypothetical protein [Gemmatimonadaceae bacterium]
MHRALRLVALVGASTFALAFAGSALAAYTPKFTISHVPVNGSPTTTITIEQTQAEDATAKVTFYAPQGYSGVLTQAAGTKLGTVAAHVQATAISQDAILPINGDVIVASNADATVAAASTACTGTTTHSAFWVLALEASGQKLSVPVFVDATTGGEATFASFKLQVCLPPPAAATFGAKLLDAALTVSNVFTAPSSPGDYVWPAFFTPYSSAAGPANPVGTVQSRAVVRLPARITLKAKVSKKKRTASFTGSVTENSAGVAGARVQLLLGTKVGFTATTKANGSYALSLKKKGKKATTTFRARVTVPARSITAEGCALT